MRKILLSTALALFGTAGYAQTTNTNCYNYGYAVQCTSTTQPQTGVDWGAFMRQQQQTNQQNQQNINRSMENLGAAIAADRERRRAKRIEKAIEKALANDPDPSPTAPPAGVPPVTLACTMEGNSISVTLYEAANRADATSGGITKMRRATFTPDAVTWNGSVWRTSISRVDLSMHSEGLLPELKGFTSRGACQIAERKF